MLTSFFSDLSPFAIVAKLLWLVQLGLIVHVVKTGRPFYWLWILFAAPAIGGLAYFLIEIAPDLRGPGRGGGFSWKTRSMRIRELRAELEETDTVKLRLRLAHELLANKEPAAACQLAEECLTGVWRDDPHTLAAVARYRLEAGKAAEALAALDQVNVDRDKMLAADVALLRGRALVAVGNHPDAQEALRTIADTYIGEEPRYFLAVSLAQTGHAEEAREIWHDIRKRFRRASRAWRRAEKRWFKLADERLKEAKA